MPEVRGVGKGQEWAPPARARGHRRGLAVPGEAQEVRPPTTAGGNERVTGAGAGLGRPLGSPRQAGGGGGAAAELRATCWDPWCVAARCSGLGVLPCSVSSGQQPWGRIGGPLEGLCSICPT